jgi:hypothetical protein
MNERIKALAVEADFMLCEDDHFYSEARAQKITKQLQKFAELIVAETVSVLQKRFMGDLNREDMEVRKCIEDVKNHFAVKE